MKKFALLFATLANYQVIAETNQPLELMKNSNSNQWIAYKMPAQENTRSMCCWNQKGTIKITGNSNLTFQSCDLDKKTHGYGTSSQSPITDNINVYAKIKNGKVKQLFSVEDSCKVKTSGHKVKWLNAVSQADSLEFLTHTAQKAKQDIAEDALYAISHHQSKKASISLYGIALDNNSNISENAVFWLGEERNDGVEYLQKLYQELPGGDVKHHINFALSQADNAQAYSLLKSIAKHDKDSEQRGDALFWLSQKQTEGIVPFLLAIVETDDSSEVQEKAIFSLSQLETEQASDALLTLAETHGKQDVRNQALFWLSQNNPVKAKAVIFKTLSSNKTSEEQEEAVFTLSQLDDDSGVEGLFQILKGDYPNPVKKKALFWLAQSDNSDVIDRLQRLL